MCVCVCARARARVRACLCVTPPLPLWQRTSLIRRPSLRLAIGTVAKATLTFSPNGAGMMTQLTWAFSLSVGLSSGEIVILTLPDFFLSSEGEASRGGGVEAVAEIALDLGGSERYVASYSSTLSQLRLTARSALPASTEHLVVGKTEVKEQGGTIVASMSNASMEGARNLGGEGGSFMYNRDF